jgi:hypothetical protein
MREFFTGPKTVVQGDAKIANFAIDSNSSKAWAFDWAMPGMHLQESTLDGTSERSPFNRMDGCGEAADRVVDYVVPEIRRNRRDHLVEGIAAGSIQKASHTWPSGSATVRLYMKPRS